MSTDRAVGTAARRPRPPTAPGKGFVLTGVGDPRLRFRCAVRWTLDVSPDALLHSSEAPSLGGMGLQIVDRMADAWGMHGDHDTSIWFELTRYGPASQTATLGPTPPAPPRHPPP